MVSLSPHTGLMFSQKHAAAGLPYPTPPSWFGNYMTHHGHHANNQFLNGGQPPMGATSNGILDAEATAPYSAHYHMLQQSSPDWSHDPYGIPTPNSQFYPNGMTPTSMHLSPSNNQHHNTSTDGSDNNNLHNSLTNIPPSPPTTVNSACSEMSSPSIGSNGMNNNHIGNGDSSPNLPHSEHNNISRSKSPYDWMKKPSYQTQQNPGIEQCNSSQLDNYDSSMELNGKTRTKDKYRVVYTDYQRLELEKEYHMSHYITIRRKSELAQSLQLSERQVKIWFQNRRAKDRKQTKKRDVNPSNNLILSNGCSNVALSMHNHNMSVAGMGYGMDIKPKLEPGLSPSAHHPHNYVYGLHHPGHHPHTHPMHQLSSMSMNLLHQNHMQSSVAVSQAALAPPASIISPTSSAA